MHKHQFELLTERCLACGQPRETAGPECDGKIQYRDVLLVKTPTPIWLKVPVGYPLPSWV